MAHSDNVSRRDFLKTAFLTGAAAVLPGTAPGKDDARRLSDEELLDLTQRQTLRYFWEFGHPDSGMTRECTDESSAYGTSTVSTGGTGFGIMAIIAGTSRGWIPRQQAQERLGKIVDFLETADQYHGVYPHWLDGKTGKTFVYPGSKDNGSDLVETSYLMMGLLAARQYFCENTPQESALRNKINKLWERVDWKWHTKNGESKELYWHWSPTHEWAMNLPIKGWNEALATHVLAAASPTHAVDGEVYKQGWRTGSDFKNGKDYYGIRLPLGPKGGGPLFMAHYSFMGLNPSGLQDDATDYWRQNRNHTLVNREHCVQNPNGHSGYGAQCWGLTSSKNANGYSDHSPTNDRGVIAPTAALSSLPYTPEESMQVLRHLMENHPHDKIMGEYGFVDAFRPDGSWYAKHQLAIDQGPIVVMAENYRSGLMWDLCMSCPEIKGGLAKLGFKSPYLDSQQAFTAPEGNRPPNEVTAFLGKLCGPASAKPMGDREFGSAIGLDTGVEWKARQIRRGNMRMTDDQQRALLRHLGQTDQATIAEAQKILSAVPERSTVMTK